MGLDLGRSKAIAVEHRHRRDLVIGRQTDDVRRTSGAARRAGFDQPSVIAEAGERAGRLLASVDDPLVVQVVPAGVHEVHRRAMATATRPARFVPSPIAAAVAWVAARPDLGRSGRVLLVDIGAGSASAATMEIEEGVYEVEALAGDQTLGGDRWTERIASWVLEASPAPLRHDLATAGDRLWRSVERAKVALAVDDGAAIDLSLAGGADRALRRGQVAELDLDLRARLEDLVGAATPPAAPPVDHLVVTGGGARLPGVVPTIERATERTATWLDDGHEAVHGAARLAAILTGDLRDLLLLECTSTDRWLEVGGMRRLVVPRRTTIPTRHVLTIEVPARSGAELTARLVEQDRDPSHPTTTIHQSTLVAPADRSWLRVEVDIDASRWTWMDASFSAEPPVPEPDPPSTGTALTADPADQTGRSTSDPDQVAVASMLRSLLPTVDAIDAARTHGRHDLVARFAPVLQVLDDCGVERITGESIPFDPERHEAIGPYDGVGGERPLVRVVRSGFAWGGGLLRPALVELGPNPSR